MLHTDAKFGPIKKLCPEDTEHTVVDVYFDVQYICFKCIAKNVILVFCLFVDLPLFFLFLFDCYFCVFFSF